MPIDQQPGGTSTVTGGNFPDPTETLQKLDPAEVKLWPIDKVVDEFLVPIGLADLGSIFKENNITGDVLLSLDKRDLKDMKIANVGDRFYIDQCLDNLRKHYHRMKREKVIWKGFTPAGPVAYFDSCWQCVAFKACKCFMKQDSIKITAQGYTKRKDPPPCNIFCVGLTNDFEDFRLLKNVQWSEKRYCICLSKRICMLQFDASAQDGGGTDMRIKDVEIAHPDMTNEMITVIKNAWTESRLVAD